MKITIELSDYEKWIIDTNQPEMSSLKDEIEKQAKAIIKPLKDALARSLKNGTATHSIELR